MKHQITFVGGQLLPLLVGLKEFSPDKIHFIISEESKNKIGSLTTFLIGKTFTENVCDPFDFNSIKSTCEGILKTIEPEDEVEFNLTGGTKIMVLAAQSLIIEKNLKGFYINQDESFLKLPSFSIEKLSSEISVVEFLTVSGHMLSSYKTINNYSEVDFKAVDQINNFAIAHDKLFLQINSKIRLTYAKLNKIPKIGELEIDNQTKLFWSQNCISAKWKGQEVFKIESPNVRTLFFYASWWELIVAREISLWSRAKELLIQCELPYKTVTNITKNEIDVLVNLGGKLIFIECKSGIVKQDDINKMRVIKDTYGGIISKSLLVCRFMPTTTIVEKCKELNIDIFFCNDGTTEVNSLSELVNALEELRKKSTI